MEVVAYIHVYLLNSRLVNGLDRIEVFMTNHDQDKHKILGSIYGMLIEQTQTRHIENYCTSPLGHRNVDLGVQVEVPVVYVASLESLCPSTPHLFTAV